jgi:hypothetical protein
MTEEKKGKVGLQQLDDDALAHIVEQELEDHQNLQRKSPGYIAFMELAKRSGWKD